MNNKTLMLLIFVIGFLSCVSTRAGDVKTDPAHDVFVENSTTNFVLNATFAHVTGKGRLGVELFAPSPGDYTVVCFIDGKFWKSAEFISPGTFELSTRGMPPGIYRITLQLIDSLGRVGSHTQKVQVK